METIYMGLGSVQYALLFLIAIALWRGLRRTR